MQRGRRYPQVRPYGIAANFKPHFRTPLWIQPRFWVRYAGGIDGFVDGFQTRAPVIDVREGRVLWHGTVTDGLLDATWDIEQLMRNSTPVIQYSVLFKDGVGGFCLTYQFWDPTMAAWELLDTMVPGEAAVYQFGSPFELSYIWDMRALRYDEIPAGGLPEIYQPPLGH